jgi:hypothetical protein
MAENDAVGRRSLLRQRAEWTPEGADLISVEVPRAPVRLSELDRGLESRRIHPELAGRFSLPNARGWKVRVGALGDDWREDAGEQDVRDQCGASGELGASHESTVKL